MVCEHLYQLERDLLSFGAKETFRGKPWEDNCREWVYFDISLDLNNLLARYHFAECVTVHLDLTASTGPEKGLVCERCKDAIIGTIAQSSIFP